LNSTTYDWWFAYYTSTYNFESFIVKTAGAFYYYDNDHDTYIRIRKLLYKNTIFKSSRRLAVYQTDEFKRVRL
jgi:hypothetical protein